MRMWMINPRLLCYRHILGEHAELHKHRHNFVRGYSITGRCERRQIEPLAMAARHEELVAEMLYRNMQHNSPYEQPDLSRYPADQVQTTVDREANLRELWDKCPNCRMQMRRNKIILQ